MKKAKQILHGFLKNLFFQMKTKILLPIFFFGTTLAVGILLSRGSWNLYFNQRKKADLALQETKTLERERCRLLRTRIRFENPIGQEELARQNGYRNPKEQPLHTMIK